MIDSKSKWPANYRKKIIMLESAFNNILLDEQMRAAEDMK
jgi:hypothetical protein